MKKVLFSFFAIFFLETALFSQTQSFELVYITKDHTTRTSSLCRELRSLYESALEFDNEAVIFYLANSDSPIIVKVNLPGDNRDDFQEIIDALVTKTETMISPYADLEMLTDIICEQELIDSDGNRRFKSACIQYYVTPSFWNLGYNRLLIANAYFALEMDSEWADKYFSMSIYHCSGDGLTVDAEHPFGPWDLCKNYKLFLYTYSE